MNILNLFSKKILLRQIPVLFNSVLLLINDSIATCFYHSNDQLIESHIDNNKCNSNKKLFPTPGIEPGPRSLDKVG